MPVHTWPPWAVTTLKSQLDLLAASLSELEALGKEHKHVEPEMDRARNWLARLLVVRSCGYLEQTVAEVARAYVDGRSGGLVRSFARTWLERSRNPTPETLEQLVGRFDAALSEDLSSVLDANDQLLRRELAFLVNARNRIAHGLNEGVGPQKAVSLMAVASGTADWFILRFNPNP